MSKEIVREEIKINKYGNKLIYSRRDKVGEGFGKRKVGDRVLVVVKYIRKEIELFGEKYNIMDSKEKEEGIIKRIVRRINSGYYDYWYKVELKDGKKIWRSYVELIK